MAKRENKPRAPESMNPTTATENSPSILRLDADLWYRMQVLLYDLSDVANDASSRQRLNSTTNELYISEPYFTPSEANQIRASIVDIAYSTTTQDMLEDIPNESAQNMKAGHKAVGEDGDTPYSITVTNDEATIERAIHARMANFLDKRKASDDARPCGPHDLTPIYTAVFGIGKEELKNERFLSRVRRSGLGDF